MNKQQQQPFAVVFVGVIFALFFGRLATCAGRSGGPSAAELEAKNEERRRTEKAAMEAQAAEQGRKNDEQAKAFEEK